MKYVSKWSLLALSTFATRPTFATLSETSRSFAEKETAASHATDGTLREELEAERDQLAKHWCDDVALYVRNQLDSKEYAMARLVAADGLSEIGKHAALGTCSDKLETLLSEAIRDELEQMDADGKSGNVLRAVNRGKALLVTRPTDPQIQARVAQWQELGKTTARETAAQAKQASLPGAELLAWHFAVASGDDTSTKELEARVVSRTSRSPQYSVSGPTCGVVQVARLPTASGEPLPLVIEIEQCDEQTKEHQTTETYEYTESVPHTYEAFDANAGEDCWYEKQSLHANSTVKRCKPRQGYRTEYSTERKTGKRLVTHRVTSLDFRGVLLIPETGERLPFSAQDSYDDQQYTTPHGSQGFTNQGLERITSAANEALAKVVQGVLEREKSRLSALESKRAESAFQAQNWLEFEDALVHVTYGGITPPAAWLSALAERHHVTVEQMGQLLRSSDVTTELPRTATSVAQIPVVEWTPEKEKLTNDRATDHFIYAHLSALYGRPKDGNEPGRYGVALGATLHSPIKDAIAFSMMTSFRVGIDHDPRFLYDLHVGLGLGSRLGPACLQLHGIGGFDRIAMGDHYELPSAWTYGGEGVLAFDVTRYKSIGVEGVLQKRTSGPDDGRIEKRLRLRFVFLGEDLSGYSFGASVEDYGIGRVYGVFVGTD
jgi:hypothetical protein